MSRYDAGTALIVVDVQNDFTDPDGSLYVPGGEAVVPVVNAEIDTATAAGARVVYTQDWHPSSTPHFAKAGGSWPVHCVAGTAGAELYPQLRVVGPIVRKGILVRTATPGSFNATRSAARPWRPVWRPTCARRG